MGQSGGFSAGYKLTWELKKVHRAQGLGKEYRNDPIMGVVVTSRYILKSTNTQSVVPWIANIIYY